MRCALLTLSLLSLAAAATNAQEPRRDDFVRFVFKVDGKPVTCSRFDIRLKHGNQSILPRLNAGGFRAPSVFAKPASRWTTDDKVGVSITCADYKLAFAVHPTLVTGGDWEAGILYPPMWIEYAYTNVIERGTWMSYLTIDCNRCDPGFVTYTSHPNPPSSVLAHFQNEQPTAMGQSARDVAYALAVFNVGYARNRDYLVTVLADSLARPKESSEDDVCDHQLLAYLVNLYWRGDKDLLPVLMRAADERQDVIGDIASFYADLLDRQTETATNALQQLPAEKQSQVCQLAGEFELWIDGPKLERVSERLHAIGTDAAERCAATAKNAASH